MNSLAPGIIETDMNGERLADPQFRRFATDFAALRRIGQLDDIADVAAFLASNECKVDYRPAHWREWWKSLMSATAGSVPVRADFVAGRN